MEPRTVVIIGAGPAGLTAAYELTKFNLRPLVLEKRDKVGGLARTENYKGFYFDLGGHRFFTKSEEVNNIWHQVLGDDFLRRPRLSRIYYDRKFFYYPLKPLNALMGLGLWRSVLTILSYLRWQLFPYPHENTFEEWVTNRFGRRLFQTFFKTYTEKVWGISCSELRAEWAAQRIKNLSLKTALLSMFLNGKTAITSLIEEFYYPRRGPGMMWNAMKDEIERLGGVVRLNCDVVRIHRSDGRLTSVAISSDGREEVIPGNDFISSMPVTEFVKRLDPPVSPEVLGAAAKLRYRDLLTVCLIIRKPHLFPDNWIYVHDPAVKVSRIQNFKNWSPDMVPDPLKTSLGLEYFCTEGDMFWKTPDGELIELGKREVDRIGLANYADIEDGCVVRVPNAYPVYDSEYQDSLAIIRKFMDTLENFQTIGRSGLHRYNNQDHAMLTGMLAARNLMLREQNDLWSVNTDQQYHERVLAPEAKETQILEALQDDLARVFLKLDRVAFGFSTGTMAGLLLFLATLTLVLKGGDVIGPNLQLLSQYFPGYSVSFSGSLIGLVYGLVSGFIGGWVFALLRNAAVFIYTVGVRRRVERGLLRRLLDYL